MGREGSRRRAGPPRSAGSAWSALSRMCRGIRWHALALPHEGNDDRAGSGLMACGVLLLAGCTSNEPQARPTIGSPSPTPSSSLTVCLRQPSGAVGQDVGALGRRPARQTGPTCHCRRALRWSPPMRSAPSRDAPGRPPSPGSRARRWTWRSRSSTSSQTVGMCRSPSTWVPPGQLHGPVQLRRADVRRVRRPGRRLRPAEPRADGPWLPRRHSWGPEPGQLDRPHPAGLADGVGLRVVGRVGARAKPSRQR